MSKLNIYQQCCKLALLARFKEDCLPFPEITLVHGESEDYLLGNVGECEFWIYEEGADFIVGPKMEDDSNHWIYEPQDYRTETQLIEQFVADLASRIKDNQ